MDNDEYKAELQKSKRELVCRLKADAEKKYDKYWYEFQVSGSTSSERTARKYEDLITVCELALLGLDEECGRCRMRRHNGVKIIETLRQNQAFGIDTISVNTAIDYIDSVSEY